MSDHAIDDRTPERSRERYHHGDLKAALIAAGEAILDERGVDGFSLREAARRAGVSPGAPAHHFGDARGLLTAIATRAFERLTTALATADFNAGGKRAIRLRAQGEAYVRFAVQNRAAFDLMWRCAILNAEDPAYRRASSAAFQILRRAIDGPATDDLFPAPPSAKVIAAWSIVHGYARLALDGAFDPWREGVFDGVMASLKV